jgi:hypothetical protein
MHVHRVLVALLIASAAGASSRTARAQEYAPASTAQVGADTVFSADGLFERDETSGGLTIDMLGGWRVARRLDVLARPVVTKRSDDTWEANLYQLAMRYTRPGDVRLRIEGGFLPSPMGILPLEARADQNPVILSATSYAATLPTFEAGTPSVQLTSANYPLALQVTTSATHWDLRAAVLGSSPSRVRPLTGDDRPPSSAQIAFGGGVTPHIGLRLGASFSHGRYAKASEVAYPSTGDRMATLVGVDADYSVGFTRVYADFVHGRYDRARDSVDATSLAITAVRTLSPRWYLAARGSRQATSDMLQQKEYGHHYYSYSGSYGSGGRHEEWEDLGAANALTVQAIAGYRLSPEVTFRAGYAGYRAFGSDELEHGLACSVVWAHRWW